MATVLLIDDDPLVLSVHELMLQDFGHEVITKCDAQSALAFIKSGADIDLVITDYQMPVMNGIEFIRALRQTMPIIPVLMLTGYDIVEIEPELGVFECLSKPVREKEFDLTVQAALNQVDISRLLGRYH
ncbi:MAG TPA: response regulator [Nitrospirota bacterium]|nr:response regulator [Nitrospirota bacterium]